MNFIKPQRGNAVQKIIHRRPPPFPTHHWQMHFPCTSSILPPSFFRNLFRASLCCRCSSNTSATSFSSSTSLANNRRKDLLEHFLLPKNSLAAVLPNNNKVRRSATFHSMTGASTTQQNEDAENEDVSELKIPLNIHALRKPYINRQEPFLLEQNMHRCPFQQFDAWFKNVMQMVDLKYEEVNAFALSTVGQNGRPSSRMLLLKGYSIEGFMFFTHSTSRKGRELADNQFASMVFYWPRVDRQVRIEGRVVILDEKLADEYWQKRPISTRIGSKLSEQSAIIPDREYLMEKQRTLEEICANEGEQAISRPEDWLGFALQPDLFEYWQGQSNRVHDRIVYSLEQKADSDSGETAPTSWTMKRLAP